MLNEEGRDNSEPFAPGARTYFVLSRVLAILGIGMVLFPLYFMSVFLLVLPLLALIFGVWDSLEYQKRFRFHMEDTHFFVRRGVILYAYTLIPYENIQDIHITQGWWERLFGVSSVILFTATTSARGSETIPGLDKASAEHLKSSLFGRIRGARNVTD